MNLKRNGKVFTSKFVGTGPSSYKKIIYRAAVSQMLRNTALGSPVENQIPTHWSMTDFSMTAQPLVLSPSSILLPSSSHCAFTHARKKNRCVFNKITSSFYYTLL